MMIIAFVKGCPHCAQLMAHTSYRLKNARFFEANDSDPDTNKLILDVQKLFEKDPTVPFVFVLNGNDFSQMEPVFDSGFVTFKLKRTIPNANKAYSVRKVDGEGGFAHFEEARKQFSSEP